MIARKTDGATDPLPNLDAPALRSALLAWYDRERRLLPWRERPSLYGTWISEIMLQQTTVAAVEPRWTEFLERFPDVRTLAAADEAEVLNVWSGLGYYRRARQLHAAAQQVVRDRDGHLPGDRAGWQDLPGIGLYTAGAIASIGGGEVVPAVDTNVVRVLSRLACRTPEESDSLRPAALQALAAALVDPLRPGDWNQALMDLGAGPCAVAAPRCEVCPLSGHCQAAIGGRPAAVPRLRPRPRPIEGVWSLLVARTPDGILIGAPQSPPGFAAPPGLGIRDDYTQLYRGYRSLPFGAWMQGPRDFADDWRAWWTAMGGTWKTLPAGVGTFRHAITKFRLTAQVVVGEVAQCPTNRRHFLFEVVNDAVLESLALNTPSKRAIELFRRESRTPQ